MANLILWNSLNIEYFPVRSLAAYHLASWLRMHGYSVKVIDFCHAMSTDDLVSITKKHIDSGTLAIGVCSTFWDSTFRWNVSEPDWVLAAREKLSNLPMNWLIGGNNSSSENLKFKWTVFTGNSEDSLLKWMDEHSAKLKFRNLFDINTSTVHFSNDDYIQPSEVLPIELARGCQFKCKFCAYPLIGKKKGTYIKDFSIIREEFIRNYNEFGTTKYYVLDDTANESEEKIDALADIVQSLPFELNWTGYNRLDLIWSRPQTISTLRDSGLKTTLLGIESFHPSASMVIGKGWMGKHAKDFLIKLKEEWKNDITWTLSFIVGLPGETREQIEETYNWCVKNEMHQWVFTPLYIIRSGKFWKSQFDLEHEQYGYTFEGDNLNWTNKDWSFDSALSLSEEMNRRDLNLRDTSGWYAFMISTLNYPINDVMNTKIGHQPWQQFRLKTRDFVDEYVRFQLK